ncbi:MAG: hypothetical protein ACREOW_06380 [Thermodesulfobacteriota bacterium]
MLPSEFPEVQCYPSLKRLLEAQVDMQFIDLQTLLRLPQEGLKGGCNFTAATVLFNIIAGSSVCFYGTSEEALCNQGDRGQRFKAILELFYPWQGEPILKDDFIYALYKSARNPLTHSLGLDAPPNDSTIGKQITLIKWPLTEEQISELEVSSTRPVWAPPTIVHKKTLAYGSIELAISVPTLYWGVHRMLHALFADSTHAAKADALAKTFSPQWDKYVSESVHVNDVVEIVERRCGRCGVDLVSIDGGQTFNCPQCNG